MWGSVARAVTGRHVRQIHPHRRPMPTRIRTRPARGRRRDRRRGRSDLTAAGDPWVDQVLAGHPGVQAVSALLAARRRGRRRATNTSTTPNVAKAVAATIADRLDLDPSIPGTIERTPPFSRGADAS